jgi:phosphatidate cytidylyltransferase
VTAPQRSLVQAVATTVMLLAIAAAAYIGGPLTLFVFVSAAVLGALWELLAMLRSGGHAVVRGFGVACGLGLLVAAYAGRGTWFVVSVGASTAGSMLLALRAERGRAPLGDAAWTLLAIVWVAGGGAAAVYILAHLAGGAALLAAYLLVVAVDDIAAYLVGARLGRRRLAPSVSPAKTWEGAAGGLVWALVAGVAAAAPVAELGWAAGLGLGLVCGLLAPVGDLLESLAKRELGVKDSGRVLPGHGGVLDRIDAMILCSPAVLAYLHWISA